MDLRYKLQPRLYHIRHAPPGRRKQKWNYARKTTRHASCCKVTSRHQQFGGGGGGVDAFRSRSIITMTTATMTITDSTINVRFSKQREDARLEPLRDGALTLRLTIRNRNRKGLTGECGINQIARPIERLTASDERLSGVESDGE